MLSSECCHYFLTFKHFQWSCQDFAGRGLLTIFLGQRQRFNGSTLLHWSDLVIAAEILLFQLLEHGNSWTAEGDMIKCIFQHQTFLLAGRLNRCWLGYNGFKGKGEEEREKGSSKNSSWSRWLAIFSAPEPKAQVHYCDHALSVVRRPSVVRLSVVCPSLTFHIFDFSSESTEQNSTKLDRKQDLNVLYQVCVFRADRKNKMAALASDWLRHFRLLLWNCWTEFNETWQEARSQRPQPSLCFSGRSEKQYGRPGLWLAETFSTSPLKPLNGIQRNLTGSKISKSSTKFVFFGRIGKTRWPPWPLIGWDIFDYSSETVARNSTKLDRKQDLNILYQVCVFRADRKNKMAALASDWLRHFQLLLWNYRTEFNETWQEASSQRPLPSLCFSGRSEKQDGRPGLWLAETFSTSPLKPLNGIQQNFTGSKISTSSTKFVFFGPIRKTRWLPWPLIGWDIFDFFSETAERNSKKLDRKQDLNVLYQVCVLLADQ